MRSIAWGVVLQCMLLSQPPIDATEDKTITIFDGRTVTLSVPDGWIFTPEGTSNGPTAAFTLEDSGKEVNLKGMFLPDVTEGRTSKASIEQELRSAWENILLQLEFADGKTSPRAEIAVDKGKQMQFVCFDAPDGFGCHSTFAVPESDDHDSKSPEYKLLTSGKRSFPGDRLDLSFNVSTNSTDSLAYETVIGFVQSAMEIRKPDVTPVQPPTDESQSITIFTGHQLSLRFPNEWKYNSMRHEERTLQFWVEDPKAEIRLTIAFERDETRRLSSKSAIEDELRSDLNRQLGKDGLLAGFRPSTWAKRLSAALETEPNPVITCHEPENGIGCRWTLALPDAEAEPEIRNYPLYTTGRRSFPSEGVVMLFELHSNSADSEEYRTAIQFLESELQLGRPH